MNSSIVLRINNLEAFWSVYFCFILIIPSFGIIIFFIHGWRKGEWIVQVVKTLYSDAICVFYFRKISADYISTYTISLNWLKVPTVYSILFGIFMRFTKESFFPNSAVASLDLSSILVYFRFIRPGKCVSIITSSVSQKKVVSLPL